MIKQAYESVMDPNVNALRGSVRTVCFQVMTILSFMWSLIFSLWIGSIVVFGPSVAAHLLLLVGIFFTAEVFANPPRRPVPLVDGAQGEASLMEASKAQ